MDEKKWDHLEILIVEDSKTQRMLLQECLSQHGARVTSAENGKEAIEKLKTLKPEIIITDIEMPEMDGYAFCRAVKENSETQNIPVILLTNLSDPMDVIEGIKCGADNFLTKPCSEQLLFSSIDDALVNRAIGRRDEPLLEFSYHGKRHKVKVDKCQITDLLLSTYSSAIEKNRELEKTNRKLSALHLELQKKNEELTELISEKNLLLGMAAHDLRNPLNAIQVYSELLQSKLADKAEKKDLKMIESVSTSSKFMLSMVNDLLNLSAIDFGKLILKQTYQNLYDLVTNNIALNESLAEQKQITLDFIAATQDVPIFCDPPKIEQVLNNLISNAIKFSHKGGKIEVELKIKDDQAILSVKDHGVGISDQVKNDLFKTFTKSGQKGTAGEQSTGLGLAIAKRIIVEHQGNIWAESNPGKGATFYISLPLRREGARIASAQ